MYCLDKLRLVEGIGAPTIYRRVCENHFERFGLRCMGYESVRDLFRGRESAGVDPPLINDPASDVPWLFALELEFPGSTDAFFHVAFDLLWGQVESRQYWSVRAQLIPAAWIQEAQSTGRADLAKEWSDQNKALSKRGRRKAPGPLAPPIEIAHVALLRLPLSINEPFFRRVRTSGYVSRRFSDPEAEARACLQHISLDGMAALMALLVEAEALTDWDRFHAVRRALRISLSKVVELPECRRIADQLRSSVAEFCRDRAPYRNKHERLYSGKPISWLTHLAPPVAAHFEEIFGHPPD